MKTVYIVRHMHQPVAYDSLETLLQMQPGTSVVSTDRGDLELSNMIGTKVERVTLWEFADVDKRRSERVTFDVVGRDVPLDQRG